MVYTDEQSYEEMIYELKSFILRMNDLCVVIETMGRESFLIKNGDIDAEKSNRSLQEGLDTIRSTFEPFKIIIENLQQRLEESFHLTPPSCF